MPHRRLRLYRDWPEYSMSRTVSGSAILLAVKSLRHKSLSTRPGSESGGDDIHDSRSRPRVGLGAGNEYRSSRASTVPSSSPSRGSLGGAQSVDRAADILLAFTHRQPVLTLGEIAEKSSLPKPTAHRLIRSLISRGLVQRTVDGRYELGFRVYELGMIARNRISLTTLACSAIETLSAEPGEPVILPRADMDTSEVVAVDSRTPPHALGVPPLDGRRPLVPPGPQGKALLAALTPGELDRVLDTYARRGPEERQLIETGQIQQAIQRTRQRGYAVDEQ